MSNREYVDPWDEFKEILNHNMNSSMVKKFHEVLKTNSDFTINVHNKKDIQNLNLIKSGGIAIKSSRPIGE